MAFKYMYDEGMLLCVLCMSHEELAGMKCLDFVYS
jgi:hypothetical protein